MTLGLLSTLSSCRNNSPNVGASSKTEVAVNSTIPFHGLWITQKYVDSLIATKSPVSAQGSEVFMKIPATAGGKVETYTFHEGMDIFQIAKSGGDFYLKNANDSTPIKVSEDGAKMLINGIQYVKVNNYEGFTGELLFKASYTDGKHTVVFDTDGTVKGLDKSLFYLVENDYFGTDNSNLNIVYIGDNPTKRNNPPFAFQFQGDTLLIYNTSCAEALPDGSCIRFKKGALKWKLVKK
jgi:hypothetical protein